MIAERRELRRQEQVVERRVQHDGDRETRAGTPARPRALHPLQAREAHHREDRGRAAVHDRGAEAAHDPRPHAGVGNLLQVEEVLDDREAGADREAEDRRIDEEADAMRADQDDDDQALQQLLDDGPDVARVAGELDAEQAEQPAVERSSRRRRPHDAARDDRDDRAQLDTSL